MKSPRFRGTILSWMVRPFLFMLQHGRSHEGKTAQKITCWCRNKKVKMDQSYSFFKKSNSSGKQALNSFKDNGLIISPYTVLLKGPNTLVLSYLGPSFPHMNSGEKNTAKSWQVRAVFHCVCTSVSKYIALAKHLNSFLLCMYRARTIGSTVFSSILLLFKPSTRLVHEHSHRAIQW